MSEFAVISAYSVLSVMVGIGLTTGWPLSSANLQFLSLFAICFVSSADKEMLKDLTVTVTPVEANAAELRVNHSEGYLSSLNVLDLHY